MALLASPVTVKEYLVDQIGLLDSKAEELVEKHSEIVDKAVCLGSYVYYPAEEILKAEYEKGDIPEDHLDPNWAPDDDEDEDDDC